MVCLDPISIVLCWISRSFLTGGRKDPQHAVTKAYFLLVVRRVRSVARCARGGKKRPSIQILYRCDAHLYTRSRPLVLFLMGDAIDVQHEARADKNSLTRITHGSSVGR